MTATQHFRGVRRGQYLYLCILGAGHEAFAEFASQSLMLKVSSEVPLKVAALGSEMFGLVTTLVG
ncbi:hypothetical protein C2L64_45775 [Paraburkholderia hospita]|uniref:Uncharacterized protein n=1 Tax=Paraburkholderia hospita TaxID=169430 RepID=A0AAN1JMD9_9BURK|nr:hypothetical protein C2L64_45775 [Paraburkholderia hospita]